MLGVAGGCATISQTAPREQVEREGPSTFQFQEAQRLFEAGQLEAAIALWEQIPPTAPEYIDAQLFIRKARLQIEDIREEKRSFSQNFGEFESYIEQAEQLERQGDYQEALKFYEEARLLEPENVLLYEKIEELHALVEDAVERHKSLGELYFARGEYNKSKAEWERLLLIAPLNTEAKQRLADLEVLTATSDRVFVERGRSLMRKGLINAARAEFEKALRVNSTNARTLSYLSTLGTIPFTEYTVKDGDSLSSIAAQYAGTPSDFMILADFNQLKIEAPLIIGQTIRIPHILRFKQTLDPDGNDLFVEEADSNDEFSPVVREITPLQESDLLEQIFKQGVVAYNQGNYREAVEFFDQVYQQDPENQEAYDYLIRAMMGLQQRSLGIEERNPEGIPESQDSVQSEVNTLIQTGIVQRKAGNVNEAIKAFEQAVQLDPYNQEGVRYLRETQDERQQQITSHLNEGIKLFNQEALNDAILEWEKVLKLDPSNEQAKDYKERAEKMLKALISTNSKENGT